MSQNHDYNSEAIELHIKHGGKLGTFSKVELKTKEDLSRSYSPGVGAVSLAIHEDKSLDKVMTLKKNTVAIVSDGSAILGLGNLGASAAIPVMEGKAAILKEFAGVDAFPICIDSQDTEEIINTIKNIAPVFGGINLEDIAAPKCFVIEERLRSELNIPVMHDDQWGAATVALAALINSLKIVKKEKESLRVIISGVGAAGVATARLFNEYGVKNIIYVDSKGVINKNRNDLNKEKLELLSSSNIQDLEGGLEEAVKGADIFVGLSKPGVMTVDMVKSMSVDPIIFALANPTPEIMPDYALAAGARIVATGRSDYANQINNSLVFPGFWRGMLDAQSHGNYRGVDNKLFIKIAEVLADSVNDLNEQNILPNMFDPTIVQKIASILNTK